MYAGIRKTTGESDSALEAYKMIASNFEKATERKAAQKQFEKMAAGETAAGQDASKAAADFAFLYSHMSKGEKLDDEVEKFIGLLKSTGSSSKAQKAYTDAKFNETYTS